MAGTKESEIVFDDRIEKLLEELAESEGFRNYTIEKGDGSMKGDGYIGIMKTAKISENDKDKILNVIVKSATKSDVLRNQVKIEDLFDREIYMYDTVFTNFKSFQEEKGLAPCSFMPQFYNSVMDYKFETLILRNIKEDGYKLYDRKIPMTEEHISLVLTEYGRFHAISFALKDQEPERFKNIVGCLDDRFVLNILKSGFIKNFIERCREAEKALDEDKDKDILDTYNEFVGTIQEFFENLLENVDEYSVALHGDCWTNNMMFKYDDKENPLKPTALCLFDFQIARLGSPVLDLSYFFYTCSPKEIVNNLDHYLQIYYDSFSDYLRRLGSDPNQIFPYSVLQEKWRQYSRYGLVFSALVIYISLTDKEEAIDFAESTEAGKALSNVFIYEIKKSDEYKERIRPIIQHFVKRGFI